ncbi:nitric oxide reductase transcriptional regulator NorR, partial [Aeromonas hydrophila]
FNLAAGPRCPPSTSPAMRHDHPLARRLGLRAATDAFQLALIEQTLAAHDGNWAATARALELDSGNLHRLAKRLGLKA